MDFDVIVIGGGHAGIEASLASAKMGAKTLLVTMLIEQIGAASCNPAIGGLGKGHLVKEIDALGGAMGYITDQCGIQFRTLNASKGPAVRGTRAQIDMDRYKILARELCFREPNLSIIQQTIDELIIQNNSVIGVITALNKRYFAKKVILTTGTFLKGKIHIGQSISYNGRTGEPPATKLGEHLRSLGLEIGRLKTGTCPRIQAKSIDFSHLEQHIGDTPTPYFSHKTQQALQERPFCPTQLPCYVTYTNAKTHQIIQDNLTKAPMFSGQIEGVGPRYCPSIEDKIHRFRDKERHQLFLEPQTIEANEYYINGLTTSLPYEIQEAIIHSIEGLEHAHITRYGYAIEYDYINPTQLKHSLETKSINNLYCAGQINGTTGYEEAGAQGILAGINAALSIKGQEPIIFRRDEAYLGVMVDDLVTKGTKEPYRLFSSRAEYRLLLREDNAIFRLGELSFRLGLISNQTYQELMQDKKHIKEGLDWIERTSITPSQETLELLHSIKEEKIGDKTTWKTIFSRRSFDLEKLKAIMQKTQTPFPFGSYSQRALQEILIEAKYASYIQKQQITIANMQKMLSTAIPNNFDYEIPSLSLEVIEKLKKFHPKSLFEASKISGITPASLEVLQLYVHLANKKRN